LFEGFNAVFFFGDFTFALFFEDFTTAFSFEDFTDAFFCWVEATEGSGNVMVEKIKRLKNTKINFFIFHLLYLTREVVKL
jgi:hypothetical protein